MITIDTNLLISIGINLSDEQYAHFSDHMMETLEKRVGATIIEMLDDAAAKELIALNEASEEAKVLEWIQANVPDYAEIVQLEFDIMMGEIAENAELVA